MEQDTFLDWLFPALYRSLRYCFPSVCSPNVLKKKTHITQTIVYRLIVSVLQTNSVFSRFLVLSSSFNSKLSVNPSWVKWCIPKTSQRSHSLERAQEVKFLPQWSGEGPLQLHADLSVYPKFWGYQVFIYSGYCSCHCRLPSEESTSGIPLI